MNAPAPNLDKARAIAAGGETVASYAAVIAWLRSPDGPFPSGEDEVRIQHYLDDGWEGRGYSPYEMLLMGECQIIAMRMHPGVCLTRFEGKDPLAFREKMLEIARQRWLDGFYADPFTDSPRQRPVPKKSNERHR